MLELKCVGFVLLLILFFCCHTATTSVVQPGLSAQTHRRDVPTHALGCTDLCALMRLFLWLPRKQQDISSSWRGLTCTVIRMAVHCYEHGEKWATARLFVRCSSLDRNFLDSARLLSSGKVPCDGEQSWLCFPVDDITADRPVRGGGDSGRPPATICLLPPPCSKTHPHRYEGC